MIGNPLEIADIALELERCAIVVGSRFTDAIESSIIPVIEGGLV